MPSIAILKGLLTIDEPSGMVGVFMKPCDVGGVITFGADHCFGVPTDFLVLECFNFRTSMTHLPVAENGRAQVVRSRVAWASYRADNAGL